LKKISALSRTNLSSFLARDPVGETQQAALDQLRICCKPHEEVAFEAESVE